MFLFGTPDTTTSENKKIPTIGDNDLFVTLWIQKVTLNASVYARLQKERALSKTKKVKYPVGRSEIRTYSFDGNSTRWEQDNVFVERVLGKVIIGLFNSNNYNGSLKHYCYACEKFGVARVRQAINGEIIPLQSIGTDRQYESRRFGRVSDSSQLQGCTNITKPEGSLRF